MTHSTQDLCKKSIAVFRSLPGLGDFLCVIPALRALRAAFPTAQIVWIGLPSVAEWVTRFDHYRTYALTGKQKCGGLRLAHSAVSGCERTVKALNCSV
ncbi:glycosyltransferase family 9 protein [Phormidesmis priestleyi]|uniref:glycosyltransferase family 9 protein n=1 Tax=Phormidesmis priestleyi TaxID=268141 RepID=UPI00083B7904|nr:hypothetical protein [Phormidesmis priestleyi]